MVNWLIKSSAKNLVHKLTFQLIVFFLSLFLFCGKENYTIPYPSFLDKSSTRTILSADTFCMLINLSDPPKSLTGSEKTQMLLSVDSIGFFISLMPSKQGSAIAFQEWISYAEGIKQDKIFLKDIG